MKAGIIGSGPAALMAADVLSQNGVSVHLFEKRKSAGRKLLVAGSSGLNITHAAPLDQFVAHYRGPAPFWRELLTRFPPERWIRFIEELGFKTFKGTSDRYFIEEMKASRFLQAWTERLKSRGVVFEFGKEFSDFEAGGHIRFTDQSMAEFDAVCFALGGGSWEPAETPLRWPRAFTTKGVGFTVFQASNVGFEVNWTPEFLKEVEGKPLKKIVLTSSKGRREGDAMITAYGLEGTPVYFVGTSGPVELDLRPDLDEARILKLLQSVKENLAPIRRVKKQLSLCEASLALVYHYSPKAILDDRSLKPLAALIKRFPLELIAPRPLAEAISSSGGIQLTELNADFSLKRFPGFFAAGEMLDWDAPTGGFLIQGCVAQGFAAAEGMLGKRARS